MYDDAILTQYLRNEEEEEEGLQKLSISGLMTLSTSFDFWAIICA